VVVRPALKSAHLAAAAAAGVMAVSAVIVIVSWHFFSPPIGKAQCGIHFQSKVASQVMLPSS